ncbi:TIGR04197 family type VII secretion effector [Enterococcus sp. LJL51]|uniref:TIGR04197 family type VII secretion effector n=1 Tax=Enterococcus sp. LJL51 TaxID=3416656 RepID=UPI003CF94413
MGVSNNTSVAGQLATGIMQGVQELGTSRAVTRDTQSTVSGNQAAQGAIDEIESMMAAIRSAVLTDANNIKNTAAEFAAKDVKLGQTRIIAP